MSLKSLSLRSHYSLWICMGFGDVDCLLHQTRAWVSLKATNHFFEDLEISGSARGIQHPPSSTHSGSPEWGQNPRKAMPLNLRDMTCTAKPFHFYLGAVLMEATVRNLVNQAYHSLMQEHWLHCKCHLFSQKLQKLLKKPHQPIIFHC